MIFAVDPGTTESAWLATNNGLIHRHGMLGNEHLVQTLKTWCPGDELAIEMVASYGMPVGREVFETCVWIGRFIEAWKGSWSFVYRRDVKLYLCGSMKAKDGNIRQALIDRYGGKEKAVGNKKNPGPLYGISGDVWSALAIALTYEHRSKGGANAEALETGTVHELDGSKDG